MTNKLEGAIFRPNTALEGDNVDQSIGGEINRAVEAYTIMGYHDFVDESGFPRLFDDRTKKQRAEERDISFAKLISTNRRHPLYFVKCASDGRLYDPNGLLDTGRHNKNLHHTNDRQFKYKSVNKRAFDFYLNFLKTKNVAYLHNAERESF